MKDGNTMSRSAGRPSTRGVRPVGLGWATVMLLAALLFLPAAQMRAQEVPPAQEAPSPGETTDLEVGEPPATDEQPPVSDVDQPEDGATGGAEQNETVASPVADGETPPAEEPVEEVEEGVEGIRLNFKDTTLDAILEYLSEAAGLTVVKDVSIDGRISIISRQSLTVEEAVDLLNTVLKEKGYAGVRTERTLKVVPLAEAKQMNIPVRHGSDPEEIPASDELVTQVIPLSHADATKLQDNVRPLLPSYAELSANADSNSLILTDTSANIKRVAEIVKGLDTHMSQVTAVRVVRLKYASATEAVKLINEIFAGTDAQAQSRRSSSAREGMRMFFGRRGGPGGDEERDNEEVAGAPSQRVKASADTRTNSVVFTGSADTLEIVEAVLKELDASPTAELAEIKVFQLEYATATDAATLINGIFGQQTQAQQRSSGGSSFRSFFQRGSSSQQTTTETTGATETATASADSRTNTLVVTGPPGTLRVIESLVAELDANPTEDQAVFVYRLKNADAANLQSVLSNLFSSSNTTTARGGTTQGSSRFRTTSATTTAAASDLAGQVYFVADEDSNSLIVMASSRHFERIRSILDELDAPVPEVLIKVLLAEVTHDDSIDLGTEFSILNLNEDGEGEEVFTDFNLLESTQGAVAKIVQKDVSVALRALAEVGKLDVLSRPYILASDNQAATITVGQEVPFITQSRTTETGQTINTVTYQDIGIILNVTPHINPDGLVILDVAPEISQLTGTTVRVSETASLPVYAKRSATSRVGIMDGQTIVIGGLVEDSKTQTIKKVPLLGDIPLLGWLFKRKIDKNTKTELLIFLTPHVALRPESLKAMSEDEQSSHEVVPKAVAPGRFQEYLDSMQRGASKDGEEAEEDGEAEE